MSLLACLRARNARPEIRIDISIGGRKLHAGNTSDFDQSHPTDASSHLLLYNLVGVWLFFQVLLDVVIRHRLLHRNILLRRRCPTRSDSLSRQLRCSELLMVLLFQLVLLLPVLLPLLLLLLLLLQVREY